MNSTLACLAGWMAHQRWYSSKGTTPKLRLLARITVAPATPDARVEVLVVLDEGASPAVVYQVPLVRRVSATGTHPAHVIGRDEESVLIDGPFDPAYAGALLRDIASETHVHAAGTARRVAEVESRVLSGEQSNTSIIYASSGSRPVICKVFRQLNPGLNPDIELQSALAGAGCPYVPQSVGHIEASWSDPTDSTAHLSGSLAFAQEFLPDVEDAWRVAQRAAADDEQFSPAAHALGAATADVHLSLAQLFPTTPADGAARAAVVDAWQRRLAIAVAEVPGLAAHREAIAGVYERALETVWPALQRIHGDLHLGQVLQAPGRGWLLIDFEGEPMRPIDERRRPDSALRDVAGMLRSFDYVPGALAQDGTAERLLEWSAAARRAFLGGYEHRMGMPATGPLLDAFELDKAVYEAIYEARNRPGWLRIPLAAIDRLVASTERGLGGTQ